MIILGIDPGLADVGFGIISENNGVLKAHRYGAISTPAGTRLALRLSQIKDDVSELITLFSPNAMAVEELFMGKNAKTAVNVAQARAAVILAGEEHGIPMFEYTPLQIKNTVTGYGRADKAQVMEMVRRLLELDEVPKPDHAADAFAVAICHARTASSLLNIKGGNDICSTI